MCYINYTSHVTHWCSKKSMIAHGNCIECAVSAEDPHCLHGVVSPAQRSALSTQAARQAFAQRPLRRLQLRKFPTITSRAPLRRPSSSNRLEASACRRCRIQSLIDRTTVRIREVVSRVRCHIKVLLLERPSTSALPRYSFLWRNSHRAVDRSHPRTRDIRSHLLDGRVRLHGVGWRGRLDGDRKHRHSPAK